MKPGLWEYLLKRLLLAAVTLVLILLTSYVLLRLAPGDPVKSSMIGSRWGWRNRIICGQAGVDRKRSHEEKTQLR